MCISCPFALFHWLWFFGFKFEFKVQKHLNLQFYLSFFLSLSFLGRPIFLSSFLSLLLFLPCTAQPMASLPLSLSLFLLHCAAQSSCAAHFFSLLSFPFPLPPLPHAAHNRCSAHQPTLSSPATRALFFFPLPRFLSPSWADHAPRPITNPAPRSLSPSLTDQWGPPARVVPNLEPGSGSRPGRTRRPSRPLSASGPHAQERSRPYLSAARTPTRSPSCSRRLALKKP
jgi:hypothetical protein